MKLKSIAAAVALACGVMLTAQAQAAQVSDDNFASGGFGQGTGNGGLFLSVYDSIGHQSLFMDLGTTASNFINNNAGMIGYSRTNSVLQGFLSSVNAAGNLTGVQWNVGGLNNPGDPASIGVIATYLPSVTINDNLDSFNGLAQGMNFASAYINTNDQNLLNGALTTDGTAVFGSQSQLGVGYWSPNYANNYGGGIGFHDTGSVGDALFTSFVAVNAADPNFNTTVHTSFEQGVWKLDAATGTVTYSAAVSAVPVPAAAWLFGSALVGLTGISRRRKSV